MSVSVALMSPFFHQHGHTRFRLRLLCLLQFVYDLIPICFSSLSRFLCFVQYCDFRWTLWFMCLILPEALVSRENEKICTLCGCLCLRVHSGICMKAGSLEPLWCPHIQYLSTYCTAEGMEMGSPDSIPDYNLYFFSLRKKPTRDSIEHWMLCWTSEWHPW